MSSSKPAALPVHIWHRCHACSAEPIYGTRYDCDTCPAGPDNHLCEACHARFLRGEVRHPVDVRVQGDTRPHHFSAHAGTEPDATAAWRTIVDADRVAPVVPPRFVVRPEFNIGGRTSFLGSYGFLLRLDATQAPLLVTALHVLDEAAQWLNVDCSVRNPKYSGRELPAAISRVHMYDVFASKWMFANVGTATSMLTLPHARIGEVEPYCQNDIAAFRVDPSEPPFAAARCATATPRPGAPVWLAVPVDIRLGLKTVAATVVESSADSFICRFARDAHHVPHSSGAPLIDAEGAVVGINVGGGCFDQRRFGHAVHAESMRRHLEDAV